MRMLVTVRTLAFVAGLVGLVAIASAAVAAVKIIELISQTYPVGQTTEALAAPTAGAASVMRLRQGAEVRVVGVVEGGGWYQIELPDKRLAYVPVGMIPAVAAPRQGAPASAAPSPPPPPATAGESGPIALPPTVEFVAASDQLSVTQPTPVFLAPNEYAPQAFTVKQGTTVEVIAKSRDGAWAWVATADGAPAYIPMSRLGPLATASQ